MAKVTLSMPELLVSEVDRLVAAGFATSRSSALQEATRLYLREQRRTRLEAGAAKLVDQEEAALADEGLRSGAPWPD